MPEFCHCNFRTSSFFVKSFDVLPKNTAQLLFFLITFLLGSIKVALHLFNEAPCFVFFIFSFPNFYELVSEPASISFFLFFVRGRTFDHCVELGFSLRTLLATLMKCFCFLFQLHQPRQILLRLLSTYLLVLHDPTCHGSFCPTALCGLLPPG